MGARIKTEKGFIDHFIELSIDPKSFLAKVDQLVDWVPFEKYLAKHLKRKPDAAGQPPYPDLVMFKVLLLQFLYNLSDDGLSSALNDRISFINFVGLPFSSSKPYGTTIGRFRNSLLPKGHYQRLLDLFNQQIEQCGLLVKRGAAVDASLIPSARRPKKVIDLDSVPKDREEPATGETNEGSLTQVAVKASYSDDHEASWTVKGGKPVYGYKIHAATDLENGFILGGHVTGANKSDTKELKRVLDEIDLPEKSYVLADKGYTSQANSAVLKAKKLWNGIMRKAAKNKPLDSFEKFINRLISKTRWKVERCFGILKQVQGFERARYLGCQKVELEFHLQALAHNVRKAVNLAF